MKSEFEKSVNKIIFVKDAGIYFTPPPTALPTLHFDVYVCQQQWLHLKTIKSSQCVF